MGFIFEDGELIPISENPEHFFKLFVLSTL